MLSALANWLIALCCLSSLFSHQTRKQEIYSSIVYSIVPWMSELLISRVYLKKKKKKTHLFFFTTKLTVKGHHIVLMRGLEGNHVCLCPPTSHHLLISPSLHQSPCSQHASLFLTTCLELGERISIMYHSDLSLSLESPSSPARCWTRCPLTPLLLGLKTGGWCESNLIKA